MKKFMSFLLTFMVLSSFCINVFATEIVPFANNTNTTNVNFSISDSGLATASYSYRGITNVFKSATIETKIQKKFGLIWITVSDGSWTDTTTATNYSRSHSVQLSSTGTYRAHVEFTISGTGGSDDEITKNVERTYT